MTAPRSLVPRLLRLAWPVALARLGIMGMSLVDVMVVGQLAPRELPHQALGWAPTSILLVTSIGLLSGVQVIGSRAIGEGRPSLAGGALRRGLVLSLAAGLAAIAAMWLLGARVFTIFGIAPELAAPAAAVTRVLVLSVPLHLAYIAAAFFFEAIQRPLASTWVMWAANAVNLGLNLLLVPRYGAIGSAWATFGARSFLALSLCAWAWWMEEAPHYGTRHAPSEPSYGALLRIGAAAGLSQAAEAGAFSGMTILAGRIGEQAVAGYQIILNIMAVVFMIALGLSTATAVLTAEAVGRGSARDTARASFTGLGLNSLCMLGAGLAALTCAHALARAYTADPDLSLVIAGLMPLAAATMLPDGGQTVAASALRAQGDNWFPTGSHVLAYALCMPALAYWLAELHQAGVAGLLWAILASSTLSVSVLILRLLWLSHRRGRRPSTP